MSISRMSRGADQATCSFSSTLKSGSIFGAQK
jgi:hypothetical protein